VDWLNDNETSDGRLKAGVIGLGAMGRHHVRIYNDLPDVDLVAAVDVSQDAINRIADQYKVNGYSTPNELFRSERLDLVSIVVPTSLHHEVALEALSRGINVLVEKPIASSVIQAEEMINAAKRSNARLMVGHVERFNPAILELKRRIAQVGTIFQISARRVGPFPDRIRDVGVVVDLATHDIDAMNFILGSPVESVHALTSRRLHASHEDMVLATLKFANGAIGALDVNWLTPAKIRQLTVVGNLGTFVADYLTQDLAFYENGAAISEWESLGELQRMSEGHAVRYAFPRIEPLKAEIEGFTRSIFEGVDAPAPPESAANALAVALDLLESSRLGQPVRSGSF
jgi:predicted dehydrogenase